VVLSLVGGQASALSWTIESSVGGTLTDGDTLLDHWAESTADFSLALNGAAGDSNSIMSIQLGLTNSLTVAQTYTITSTLPIKPLTAPVDFGGSMGVTITDGIGALDLAVLSTSSPDPFFQGLIDGVAIAGATIFGDPYVQGCVSNELLPCTVADNGSFSSLATAKHATTSIGIRHTFTLTPGDSIGISSNLAIADSPDPSINLPEPSTAVLLASGLGILAMLSRAKR